MAIFNRYFGYGAFGSVLFQEVRSKRGLAYDIDGGLFPAFSRGLFQVSLATRVEQAPAAIKEVWSQIGEAREEVPAADRISAMKSSAGRSFIFNFENAAEVVQRASILDLYRYPADYDDIYLPSIAKVEPPAVRDVAARWIKPSNVVTVVVGRVTPEALRQELGAGVPIIPLTFDELPHWTAPGEKRDRL
jgi:zinc protease